MSSYKQTNTLKNQSLIKSNRLHLQARVYEGISKWWTWKYWQLYSYFSWFAGNKSFLFHNKRLLSEDICHSTFWQDLLVSVWGHLKRVWVAQWRTKALAVKSSSFPWRRLRCYNEALLGDWLVRKTILFFINIKWSGVGVCVCPEGVFGCVIWWAHKAVGLVWPKPLQWRPRVVAGDGLQHLCSPSLSL